MKMHFNNLFHPHVESPSKSICLNVDRYSDYLRRL